MSATSESVRCAADILRLRLANQHLLSPCLGDATRLVAHLGAVQAQDYGAAQWALGQRLVDSTAATVERAFADGAILRTHVLRPTWHFVSPADIRWLLQLTAPRIKASMAFYDRRLGIDDALIARSNSTIARALEHAHSLTRPELDAALREDGITARDAQTLGHLIMHAELDALICSGPRRGKQLSYALLDRRAPAARPIDRDAALAELTTRFFLSHGPATLRDCAWWSGLTTADVRRGSDLNGSRFVREVVDGLTYVFANATPSTQATSAYLLPNFDEYTVAYRDRGLFYSPTRAWTVARRDEAPFGNVIVFDGRVVGMWKRTLGRGTFCIQAHWFDLPSEVQRSGMAAAAERYAAFFGLRAEIVS